MELECLLIENKRTNQKSRKTNLVELTETFQKSTDYKVGFLLCSIA